MRTSDGSDPLLIVAAGGTGGHVFPAQALAEEMLKRGWRIELWTDHRGRRFSREFPPAARIRMVTSAGLHRGRRLAQLIAPWMMAVGIVSAWTGMYRLRPSAVVGFGGYPAFPPLAAAWLRRIPRLIHEQNSVLGKANLVLSRHVNLVACGSVSTTLPAGVRSVTVGNPVRETVLAFANSLYSWPDSGRIEVLVLGGSQGAQVLDRTVQSAVLQLPDSIRRNLHIVQQVRSGRKEEVVRIYQEAGVQCEIADFFSDAPRRMARAHLVIARAGASTVAELAVIGRPAILIPFAAAANDHQTANAEALANCGAAIALPETDASAETLMREMMLLMENPRQAESMAHAALKAAQPKSAEHLADLVEDIASDPA
ncbi:MAG: undecaprenyldiphospho-muramoylpentapeptide beta-N-acetylglucosaminyltransferase [Rhodobacteraceae bacterium]|nr:undecaprenyldiphospho-muramoylpentapeptide beta-N-acetylglucosaminyltransferase [Paracoccaceae bacterium]